MRAQCSNGLRRKRASDQIIARDIDAVGSARHAKATTEQRAAADRVRQAMIPILPSTIGNQELLTPSTTPSCSRRQTDGLAPIAGCLFCGIRWCNTWGWKEDFGYAEFEAEVLPEPTDPVEVMKEIGRDGPGLAERIRSLYVTAQIVVFG